MSLIIALITISLTFIIFYFFIKYGEKSFNPSKEEIYFKIINDKIIFKSDKFSGIYEMDIPNNIKIQINDKISISYNYNRGYLTKVNEFYLNNNLILSKEQIKTLNLKMILGD